MCLRKPECQRCETCGQLKYQFWVNEEMHDRGCPWGFERMDRCPDAINTAKRVYWCRENGVNVTKSGKAMVDQMLAAGVDLAAPPVDFDPAALTNGADHDR